MIRIEFSKEEAKKINYLRYNHPDPKIQKRFEVLWLKHLKYSHKEIAIIADVHPDTVTDYLKAYSNGGIEQIQSFSYRKQQSELAFYRDAIKESFNDKPPQTLREACARIEQLTGIKRKKSQVHRFMQKMGFKKIKAAQVPAKADSKKQRDFLEQMLNPRIEEAKAGKRAILFMDGAHFIHAIFLGMLWCLTRIFVKSASGRKRFNVLGAVDAITHQFFNICNDSYINAQTVCDMLRQIALHYTGRAVTIVLDNARYQKCKLVTETATELGIELLYLPSYSPNLNLIERLWKYVKQNTLSCKYYETFNQFTEAIQDTLANANGKDREQIAHLLTLNFHILDQEVKEVKMAA